MFTLYFLYFVFGRTFGLYRLYLLLVGISLSVKSVSGFSTQTAIKSKGE